MTYIIIVLYNIEKLQKNINLLKLLWKNIHMLNLLHMFYKRHIELELAIQLRIEVISEFYSSKFCCKY